MEIVMEWNKMAAIALLSGHLQAGAATEQTSERASEWPAKQTGDHRRLINKPNRL